MTDKIEVTELEPDYPRRVPLSQMRSFRRFWRKGAKVLESRLINTTPEQARTLARTAVLDFLIDENIQFGDSEYDWSDPNEIMESYILDHAETE